MYNKNDNTLFKVLKNSPNLKNYTIIWKRSCRIQMYHPKRVLTLKNTKKGRWTENLAENDHKWTLGDLWGKSWPLITKLTISSDSMASKYIKDGVIYYSDIFSF